MSRTIIDTSFENSLMSCDQNKPKVTLQQLCSELIKLLQPYDTVLSIKQLYDVEKRLCDKYSVKRFSDLGITDNDDIPLDLISFLYTHREQIDSNGELSIYQSPSSVIDRQEMYSFVNQLVVLNDREEGHDKPNRELYLTKDQSSAVEKAVRHKFGGLLGFNRSSQIINKAKQKHDKNKDTIIQ